ncbi:hypothetical protein GUJ93_ZPchr0007g5051 [Zizania palustris]|uniref:Uncharacterized protein n=1 Tax=Zizania palustris TaxID=103762 RepID=A0A8J5TD06_ZIZPA|nr:hypothetical protein GUJ93_ZPchr0007g5051 [Zizania palustris]
MAAALVLVIMAPVIAATVLPSASGDLRPVESRTTDDDEADLCVRRCVGEMLACEEASGCAAAARRGVRCGGGCESEYLGCIDVC